MVFSIAQILLSIEENLEYKYPDLITIPILGQNYSQTRLAMIHQVQIVQENQETIRIIIIIYLEKYFFWKNVVIKIMISFFFFKQRLLQARPRPLKSVTQKASFSSDQNDFLIKSEKDLSEILFVVNKKLSVVVKQTISFYCFACDMMHCIKPFKRPRDAIVVGFEGFGEPLKVPIMRFIHYSCTDPLSKY